MLQKDPDFIITIDGEDIIEYLDEWEIEDKEEGTSTITVKLVNPDMRLSGRYKVGQNIEIRFGYTMDMSQKATLPVMEIEEEYRTGGELVVKVVGRDPTSKMGGGKKRGKGKGVDLFEDNAGLQKKPGSLSGSKNAGLPYVMNENDKETTWKFGICISDEEDKTTAVG
jgi:hypothetical protein